MGHEDTVRCEVRPTRPRGTDIFQRGAKPPLRVMRAFIHVRMRTDEYVREYAGVYAFAYPHALHTCVHAGCSGPYMHVIVHVRVHVVYTHVFAMDRRGLLCTNVGSVVYADVCV